MDVFYCKPIVDGAIIVMLYEISQLREYFLTGQSLIIESVLFVRNTVYIIAVNYGITQLAENTSPLWSKNVNTQFTGNDFRICESTRKA